MKCSMTMDAMDILIGVVLPFAVTAAVFGLSLCRGASRQQKPLRVGAVLAAALGFFAGYASLPWAVCSSSTAYS